MSTRKLFSLLLVVMVLGGCTAAGVRDTADDEETWDPFEPFNRAMFTFNEKFDDWLLKPVAKGYDWLLPQPVKNGVGNFFTNLSQPASAVNNLLQGKPKDSAKDLGRFVINSTVGVLGLMDIARDIGLEPREEDWGQTFAVWGVGEGPYFVWPIIGPRSLRETFGWALDWYSTPQAYVQDPYTHWGSRSLDVVDIRARLLPAEKVVDTAAGEDKYIFIREAYRQRRRSLVYDGNPPKPKFFEEEIPANNTNNHETTVVPEKTESAPAAEIIKP